MDEADVHRGTSWLSPDAGAKFLLSWISVSRLCEMHRCFICNDTCGACIYKKKDFSRAVHIAVSGYVYRLVPAVSAYSGINECEKASDRSGRRIRIHYAASVSVSFRLERDKEQNQIREERMCMRKVYLLGRSGIHANEKFLLEDELIIGRDAHMCQLIYPESEKKISGIHCKLQVIEGKVCLIDLNSTNGTFYQDGTRLRPNMPRTMGAGQGFYLGNRENAFDLLVEEEITEEQRSIPKAGNGLDMTAILLCAAAVLVFLVGYFVFNRSVFGMFLRVTGIVLGMMGLLRFRQLRIGEKTEITKDGISLAIVIGGVAFIILTMLGGVFGAVYGVLNFLDGVGGFMDTILGFF